MAFYWFKNYIIWFRECQDMTISGSHVILTWLGDYLLVISQNKFYKLWENCGKWGEIVPIREHSFQSIRLQSGLVATGLWQLLCFLQFKTIRLFMFWIQGQPDFSPVWSSCQSVDQLPTGLWNTSSHGFTCKFLSKFWSIRKHWLHFISSINHISTYYHKHFYHTSKLNLLIGSCLVVLFDL